MSVAKSLTDRSDLVTVTAFDVGGAGGRWDSGRCLYVFPDGSTGAFVKSKPFLKDSGDGKSFAGYGFSDNPDELNAARRPEKVG